LYSLASECQAGVAALTLAVPGGALGPVLDGDAEVHQILSDAIGDAKVLTLACLGALLDPPSDV
jgi:hypothetical protein